MRSAFVEAEKSLIEKINAILPTIDQLRFSSPAGLKAKTDMRAALIEARDAIIAEQQTYQHPQTPEYTTSLYAVWHKIETLCTTFSRDTEALCAIVNQYTRHAIQCGTRKETINEFIANISVVRDGGAAQNEAVLSLILRNIDAIHSRVLPVRFQGTILTPEQLATLEEDEAITRMQRNQDTAMTTCMTRLNPLDEMTKKIAATEKECTKAWADHDRLIAFFNKNISSSHKPFDIIADLIKKLNAIQSTAKCPQNDFGLAALLHEMQFGQKETFKQFKSTQKKFRGIAETSNRFANVSPTESDDESPPTSPTESGSISTRSSSSFFSASSSSGGSSGDDADAFEDRKRARSGSSNDSDDSDIDLLLGERRPAFTR